MQNPLPAVKHWATGHPKMMWLTNGLVTALLQTVMIWTLSLIMVLSAARWTAYFLCGQVNFVLNHNTTWNSRHHPDITKLSRVWGRFLVLNISVGGVNTLLQMLFAAVFATIATPPGHWILAFGLSYANVGLANAICAVINWLGYDKFVFRHVQFDDPSTPTE